MRLIIILVFIGYSASAQVKITMGQKTGLNLSKFDYYNGNTFVSVVPASYLANYHVGIYGLFRFEKYGVQIEALYSRQGSSTDLTRYGGIYTQIARLDYLALPVLFKWYLPARFNVQGGPQLAFAVKRGMELRSDGTATTLARSSTSSADADYKAIDLNFTLGVGWESTFGLSVDARYGLGALDINKHSPPNSTYSRIIQFSVGYQFYKVGSKSAK